MRGLPFRLGRDLYALRLADIAEVLPLATLRHVPGVDAAVAGLLNLHGRAVPVVDLAQHCLGRPEPVDVRTRIVLLPGDDRSKAAALGVVLGTTGAIVDLSEGAMQPCPLSTATLPFLAGMSHADGETLQWIAAPALRATLAPLLRDREARHA